MKKALHIILIVLIILGIASKVEAQDYTRLGLKIVTNLNIWGDSMIFHSQETSITRAIKYYNKKFELDNIPNGKYRLEIRSVNKSVERTVYIGKSKRIKMNLKNEYYKSRDTFCFWEKLAPNDTMYISILQQGCFFFGYTDAIISIKDSVYNFNINYHTDSIRHEQIFKAQMKEVFLFEKIYRIDKDSHYYSTTRTECTMVFKNEYLKIKGGYLYLP